MQSSWIRAAVTSVLLGADADPAQAAGEMVSLDYFARCLEEERSCSRDGARLWRMGEQLDLGILGTLGQAMAPCGTLGEALRTFVRGFPVVQSNSRISFDVLGSEAHVSYRVLDPRIWPRRADAELSLGLIRGVCARYAVPRGAIQELCFEHEPDRNLRDIARYLGCSPRFGQDENRIVFSASVLSNTPRHKADVTGPPGARQLDDALSTLRKQTPVSQRVYEMIMSQIEHGPVSQTHIAAGLGMSERSLRRALATEGQPFHEILEHCRRTYGFFLLVRSNRLFGEIALLLGYSDQTAFSRAFSRWYGASPRELRKMGAEEVSVIR